MRVPPQAALSQAHVRAVGCRGEQRELPVGPHDVRGGEDVGQLPRVEGPHQDTVGVDVGPGGQLRGSGRQ